MRVKKELVCFAQKDDIWNDIRRINREDGLNPHPLCTPLRISMWAGANGNISVL